MPKILKKRDLPKFLNKLIKKGYEVIAPIKTDTSKFSIIKDPNQIYLEKLPEYPVKNFFFPQKEVLFEFKNNKIIERIKPKKRIIFGIRKCDINGLLRLDHLFSSEKQYKTQRENTILIGLNCKNPDEYCFCESMDLKENYDLFFYEDKNNYYISIGSKKGLELVKNLKNLKKQFKEEIRCKKYLEKKDYERFYYNPGWQELANKCLSCAACTILCPTCACFDVNDEFNLDLKSGKRTRQYASCQLKSFTKIAGNKVFRESRLDRYKHFVYHKILYFRQDFHENLCVGCGRCIRHCPKRIDWVELINKPK